MSNEHAVTELLNLCSRHFLRGTKRKPSEICQSVSVKKHLGTWDLNLFHPEYEVTLRVVQRQHKHVHVLPVPLLEIVFEYLGTLITGMFLQTQVKKKEYKLWLSSSAVKNLSLRLKSKSALEEEYYMKEASVEELQLLKQSDLSKRCFLYRGDFDISKQIWTYNTAMLAIQGAFHRNEFLLYRQLSLLPLLKDKIPRKQPRFNRLPAQLIRWIRTREEAKLVAADVPFLNYTYEQFSLDTYDRNRFKELKDLPMEIPISDIPSFLR